MRTGFLTIGALLAFGVWPQPVKAADNSAPDAVSVIARGAESLEAALRVAARPAWEDPTSPRPIAVVLDGTPYTRRARLKVRSAVAALGKQGVPSWQVGRLGRSLSAPMEEASAAAEAVPELLSKKSDVTSTLAALQETLKGLRGTRPVVVYLADWHFEDDAGLENFIRSLKRRGVTLSVVGSEAAFGRGWTDGICEDEDRRRDSARGRPMRDHFEGIGRSPFRIEGHEAPWHGGDTAYPHQPYRWWSYVWNTSFSDHDLSGMGYEDKPVKKREDLAERRKRPPPLTEAEKSMEFPLPSSFGPYALMRAAGVTGGRYVLWSFNPRGRRTVRYDFSRCNLFPPDLRPRKEILADLRRNRWARATQQAWHALRPAGQILLEHTSPLEANLKKPAEQVYVPFEADHYLNWDVPKKQSDFIETAQNAIAALVKADKILAKAIGDGEPPEAGPMRRHQADAMLMQHIVRSAEFQLREAITAARHAKHKELSKSGAIPTILSHVWIEWGREPQKIGTRKPGPFDAKRGARLLEERRVFLERFLGTPFGEQVALNGVHTWRPNVYVETPGIETGRTPSESGRTGPGTGRGQGGGSKGGGTSTGR